MTFSLFIVCCNRGSRGCATHALVENILSLIASIVLLVYDARFLRNPYTCLWPYGICDDIYWDIDWSAWWNFYTDDIYRVKLIAIKVQLACAAMMLFLNVVFIAIYIYTSWKVRTELKRIDPQVTIELRNQQFLAPPPVPIWSNQPPAWTPPTNT